MVARVGRAACGSGVREEGEGEKASAEISVRELARRDMREGRAVSARELYDERFIRWSRS